MADINLLAKTNLAPNAGVLKTSNSLKLIAFISTIIYFVAVLFMVSYFIYNSFALRASNNKQEQLKASITALEPIEQQYVLVKDRAVKIQMINANGNALKDLSAFMQLSSSLPDGGEISQVDIIIGRADISLIVTNSSALTQSLSTIISSEEYNYVNLKSFTYQDKTGYVLELVMERT